MGDVTSALIAGTCEVIVFGTCNRTVLKSRLGLRCLCLSSDKGSTRSVTASFTRTDHVLSFS